MLLGGQRAAGRGGGWRKREHRREVAGGWLEGGMHVSSSCPGREGPYGRQSGLRPEVGQTDVQHSDDAVKDRMLGMALRSGKDLQGRPGLCSSHLHMYLCPCTPSSHLCTIPMHATLTHLHIRDPVQILPHSTRNKSLRSGPK